MPWLACKPFGDIHSICPHANTPILVNIYIQVAPVQAPANKGATSNTTVMLLGVSVAFVVLVTPNATSHLVSFARKQNIFQTRDPAMVFLREVSQVRNYYVILRDLVKILRDLVKILRDLVILIIPRYRDNITKSRENITRSRDNITRSREIIAGSRENITRSRENITRSRYF